MTNPYVIDVSKFITIDVYDICNLYDVPDSSGATQHAVKKLLCAGNRGYKDQLQDIREAVRTLNRRITLLERIDADNAA